MDNLDKFYTHPDIAKMFVDKINEICPLDDFDMVLEPSAGSGHILEYLPDDAIGKYIYDETENSFYTITVNAEGDKEIKFLRRA